MKVTIADAKVDKILALCRSLLAKKYLLFATWPP